MEIGMDNIRALVNRLIAYTSEEIGLSLKIVGMMLLVSGNIFLPCLMQQLCVVKKVRM